MDEMSPGSTTRGPHEQHSIAVQVPALSDTSKRRRPRPSKSQSGQLLNTWPRKRTNLVHALAGDRKRMDDGDATGNNPAMTADPNELAPPTTSPALPLENSEPGHSTYPKKRKTDPSGPLSDQDFASWREYCWFYAHNQDRHASDAWSSCRRPKNAISHITRHAEDVHGLSRGRGSEYTKQVYLARCAQNDPSVEGNTPCDTCKSVGTWSTTQLADPTHEGAALCLRCYTVFATKKELFAHLSQGFLCVSRQMKLSKQTKSKISYMAFCSATQPPSGDPPPALLFITTQGSVADSHDAGDATTPVIGANRKAAMAQPEALFLAGIPEIARQPPLQIQTHDAMAAEASLLMRQAGLSSATPVWASSTGASPSIAPGAPAHSLNPWIPLQTRFLGLGPALDHPPPAFQEDWLPGWMAAHGRLTDEGYSTLTSSGATVSTHHHTAAQSTTLYAPPRVLTAPLTAQLEPGYGTMFDLDVHQPGYNPPGHSGMADGGLSFGSDSVDPAFAAMPWQQAPACSVRVGTPPASAQQCSASTNPTFGDLGTGNSSYNQPGLH